MARAPLPVAIVAMGALLPIAAALAPVRAEAARASLEVELAPGVAIPLTDYLVTEGQDLSEHVRSGVGFGMALHVLLDDWEFRYAATVLPTSSVETRVGPTFADAFNGAATEINEVLGQEVVQAVAPGSSTRPGDAVTVHHVQVGYRFYPYRSRLQVYIPLGLGLALTTSSEDMLSRTLYGGGAHTGIGLDFDVLPWLRVGGSVRYLFTVSESSGDVTLLDFVTNLGFTEDLIDTAYHLGHFLHVSATAMVRF